MPIVIITDEYFRELGKRNFSRVPMVGEKFQLDKPEGNGLILKVESVQWRVSEKGTTPFISLDVDDENGDIKGFLSKGNASSETNIVDVRLDKRIKSPLLANGYETVEEIQRLPRIELVKIPDLGPKRLKELEAFLAEFEQTKYS
jgi:hypothetical protein